MSFSILRSYRGGYLNENLSWAKVGGEFYCICYVFLLFCAFDVNARATVLTTIGDTTSPINMDNYNNLHWTGLLNNYNIEYNNSSTLTTYAVSGSNVTDGIINSGTISEVSNFNATISNYIGNEASNVQSILKGNIIFHRWTLPVDTFYTYQPSQALYFLQF